MSILFCTPCYGGMLTAAHFRSCMNLKEALTIQGLPHDWLIGENESLVHRARMVMTKSFLDTSHTHMMWLDADIEFEPEDVAKLWNMDVDIAVGVYAMKRPDKDWFAAWVDGALVKDLDQYGDTPIAVDYAGTGFMLIRREVIEALSHTVPWFEYDIDDEKVLVPGLYQTPIHDGAMESEDYFFCRIAREEGYKVMMDPTVRLKHWGLTKFPIDRISTGLARESLS